MRAMFKKGEPESVSITLPEGALGGWHVLLLCLEKAKDKTGLDLVFGGLIEQIESQLPKPKPEEPTGFGAVVLGEGGRKWVRSGAVGGGPNWQVCGGSEWFVYDDVRAVEVLSHGVPL